MTGMMKASGSTGRKMFEPGVPNSGRLSQSFMAVGVYERSNRSAIFCATNAG